MIHFNAILQVLVSWCVASNVYTCISIVVNIQVVLLALVSPLDTCKFPWFFDRLINSSTSLALGTVVYVWGQFELVMDGCRDMCEVLSSDGGLLKS